MFVKKNIKFKCFHSIYYVLKLQYSIGDELVHCDGYIIRCLNDRRLPNKVCDAAKGGKI